VDVHYYEDGNVRMLTEKSVSGSASSSASAPEVIKQIASIEKKYQEDLNKAFTTLSEGAFKGLRRQLPVTRQKVDWDKVGGYRVSILCRRRSNHTNAQLSWAKILGAGDRGSSRTGC